MKLRSVVSEAWWNLASGTTRTLTFTIALASCGAVLGIADAQTIVGLEQDAARFRELGASIQILEASGAVSGTACERLAEVEGITAAGALRVGDSVTLRAAPGSPLTHFEASPRFPEVLRADILAGGVVVPDRPFAINLGLVDGATVASDEGPITVSGTYAYPEGGQRPALESAVVSAVARHELFDECWLEIWPSNEAVARYAVTALSPSAAPDLRTTTLQLNTGLGSEFDGAELFRTRTTRLAPVLGWLIGAVLGWAAVRLRRLELASARHSGVQPVAQMAQLVLETLSWAAAGWLVALPALLMVSMDSTAALDAALRVATATAVGAVVGALIATSSIRERHLFVLFKAR